MLNYNRKKVAANRFINSLLYFVEKMAREEKWKEIWIGFAFRLVRFRLLFFLELRACLTQCHVTLRIASFALLNVVTRRVAAHTLRARNSCFLQLLLGEPRRDRSEKCIDASVCSAACVCVHQHRRRYESFGMRSEGEERDGSCVCRGAGGVWVWSTRKRRSRVALLIVFQTLQRWCWDLARRWVHKLRRHGN